MDKKNQVPFLDLKWQHEQIKNNLKVRWDKILENTAFVMGEETKIFEENFAKYCNSKHCIGVSSGTDALILSMKALDLPPGSEVITLPTSFIASASSIIHAGLVPRFIDVDLITGNYDYEKLQDAVNEKTKAIMVVHLYGRMGDMDKIIAFAQKNNLKIIEDSAQAHGAKWKGGVAGSFGDIACFSFYPGKNLGAYGHAGGVITNSDELTEKVRRFRDHGSLGKYDHTVLGHNNKIDNLQAAVLDEKLKHLDNWNSLRQDIAKQYYLGLLDLQTQNKLNFISPDSIETESVHHIFAIRVKERDNFISKLKDLGVSTNIHYPQSLNTFSFLQNVDEEAIGLPIAEKIQSETVSLPIYPGMTNEQVKYVIESVKQVLM